ncbi:class I SAM-dependent methyltransferase [Streptosporangium sp. NBC_01495]|uniref:class I SAM-dependent methyltransferase n=1 Tax=Streptosporangium sp. NBC_01495 TaxID=2903899 RepID=UPI003FCC3087
MPLLDAAGARTVVDFGCGVGNDTLPLLDAGFDVTSCDYDSPSTAFLRWRLHRRGQDEVPVVEPAQTYGMPCPDALWIIDTLDHLPDIEATLGHLLEGVRVVVCEDLAVRRGVTRKGFHQSLDLDEVVRIFERHGLLPAPRDPASPVMGWLR